MKKLKHQESGVCSECGGNMLDYGEIELADESVGYTFVCDDCGFSGIEWYNLVYDETVAN